MKTNAPEKIYRTTTYLNSDRGNTKWKKVPIAGAENIEYIRIDAFIEKACEFFGEHLWEYINVKNANCDTFINIDGDKLKKDFKNYIKGENEL